MHMQASYVSVRAHTLSTYRRVRTRILDVVLVLVPVSMSVSVFVLQPPAGESRPQAR